MNSEQRSGLDILQAMITGAFPAPSMNDTIPMRIVAAEKGRVMFHATANDKHLNPMGGVHGGFAATVLDSVTACVVHSMLDAGIGYGTIDLSVKMFRPVPKNENLYAAGSIVNISKSFAASEATLKTQEGKLLATATATCKIINP